MRPVIHLGGSSSRLPPIHIVTSALIAGALCGGKRTDCVLTEPENHNQCLKADLQVLPPPAPTGSNKTWTKDKGRCRSRRKTRSSRQFLGSSGAPYRHANMTRRPDSSHSAAHKMGGIAKSQKGSGPGSKLSKSLCKERPRINRPGSLPSTPSLLKKRILKGSVSSIMAWRNAHHAITLCSRIFIAC